MAEELLEAVERLQSRLSENLEPKKLLKTLRRLGELPMTVEILVDTGVGKTVNSFRKHELAGEVAKGLVAKWKKLVPQPVADRHSISLHKEAPRSQAPPRGHHEGGGGGGGGGGHRRARSPTPQPVEEEEEEEEEEMEERQQRRHREEEMVTEEEEEEPGYSRGYSPSPPPQHHQHSPPRHERYSPQPRGGGYRSDEYDDSPQPSPPPVAPSPPPPVRGRDAPRHGKPHKGPGGAAPAQPPQATRGSHGDRRDRERVEERPQKKRVVEAEWSPGGGAKTAKHSRHATPPEGKREKERGEREEREERKKGGADGRPQAPKDPGPGEEDDSDTPTMSFESFLMYDASPKTPKKKKSKPSSSSSSSHSRPPRPSSSSSSSHARTQPAAASSSSSSSSSKPSKSNGTKSSKKSEVVSSPVAATPEKRRRVVEAVPAMPDFPLPAIQPNYRPLPSLDPQPLSPQRRKVPQANGEDESGFTGKRFNSKMTVYSGTKTAYLPKMMSLYEQCLRVLQNNIDSIDEVGGVPFLILEPVLERCTPEQLYRIEECNSCFIADSDDLWLRHCQRDFRRSAPDEYESWREMYLRLHDEREERLRMLTQNISSAHANKPKGRQVKMAFVNSVAKPPRDVRRRQEKFGTLSTSTARSAAAAAPIKIRPATSYSVPGDPSQFSSSSSASYSQGSPPHGSARASLGAAVGGPPGRDKPVVKKIAPMMAKTIKAFKNRFSRR
ncbi:elongin-A [Gadus morhua]|uniref:elongin-A n=1 Tax=Gadus morhua TaxID=8049 RepID=UPI0011B3C41A|nr:elongin-A [Gadus morhua]